MKISGLDNAGLDSDGQSVT